MSIIDLHTHILPGLDDGPSGIEEALEMCRLAADDCTAAVVASPHMFNGMFDVARGDILNGVSRLQGRLDAEGISLRIVPGADVHAVPDLARRVRGGYAMTIGDLGKYLIIELPQDVLPQGLSQLLFSIQLMGVTPIISHPERNMEVQADPLMMTGFVKAGSLVQLTAASITGDFGEVAQECARALITSRLAHVVASDAHSIDRRPPGLSRALAVVRELLPCDEAEEMFVDRPLRILAGEYVDLPESREPPSEKKKRFSWRDHAGKQLFHRLIG
jgi:protein-tyrosine phosphatase